MAKQKGIMPISGAIENFQFFQSKSGSFRVSKRRKSDPGRIFTDDRFERTRENMAEFTSAMKAGKLIRTGLHDLLRYLPKTNIATRLNSRIFEVIKADPINKRGQRNIADGDLEKLVGFDFNPAAPLETIFKGNYQTETDRTTGKLSIQVSGFIPRSTLNKPLEATHFQFHVAALEVDTVNPNVISGRSSGPMLVYDNNPVQDFTMEASVTPGTANPLIIVMSIDYWQHSNGEDYAIKNAQFNSAGIVGVSKL